MPRALHLIVHARAAADSGLQTAVAELRSRGHSITEAVSHAPAETRQLAEAAARSGIEAVIAAGGDGTLNAVLHGLAAAGLPERTALGVVPLGTANDYATSAGIPPGDPLAALELAATAAPQQIDLGRLNGHYFLNVASGGFGSEVTAATSDDLKQWLGGVAYLLTGLRSWGSIRAR